MNEIKIICPKRKCGKCIRMVARVEEAIKISGIPSRIEIVNSLDEMMKYSTWILPTLVINEEVTARGYVPSVKMIAKQLKTN